MSDTSPENILITGITGSGGSYLTEYILENHPEVTIHGLCRWHSTTSINNLSSILDKIKIYECDLLDLGSIIRILQVVKPTKIFHLAAYANVKKCFDTPLSVINNNIMGTANLLEAVKMVSLESILQICSTSEVYGNPLEMPMRETHPTRPVNPYAVSKLSQEALAYSYFCSWNLKVIITRMFAYINPRRADLFATAFALQIARIEQGKQDILEHGNLDSLRTIIDVRDAMASYWIACQHCQYGELYNIGGPYQISIGDFLEILKSKSTIKIESKQSEHLMRPVDVTCQIPDVTKFYNITNWKPKYTIEESVDFLLDYCRNIVRKE